MSSDSAKPSIRYDPVPLQSLRFEEARNDLESGIILNNSYKYHTKVFLFQQPAEKCAKATTVS